MSLSDEYSRGYQEGISANENRTRAKEIMEPTTILEDTYGHGSSVIRPIDNWTHGYSLGFQAGKLEGASSWIEKWNIVSSRTNIIDRDSANYKAGRAEGLDNGSECFDAGSSIGYDKGYKEGYGEGLKEGKEYLRINSEEVYDTGYEDGKSEGFDKGHEKGFAEGKAEGFDAGSSIGYDEGYSIGHGTGYDKGYAEAYSKAYASGYKNGDKAGFGKAYRELEKVAIEAMDKLQSDSDKKAS